MKNDIDLTKTIMDKFASRLKQDARVDDRVSLLFQENNEADRFFEPNEIKEAIENALNEDTKVTN